MKLFVFLLLSICCFAKEKILFLHIPKSGGTTFRSILQDRYSSDESKTSHWHTVDLNTIKFENLSLLTGHFIYSKIRNYTKDFKKVVFMRNPVDRVLSEHRYVFDRDHINPSKILKQHFLPENGDPIDTAANVACLLLSQLNPLDPNISIERHLESAKETLLYDVDFVGITEQMNESIALFHNLLGWRLPEEIPVHNTTDPSHSNYPQSILYEIAERNWADIELYRFAKDLFEMQKLKTPPLIQEEIVQWTDQITYDFKEPLDGFGWCPREFLTGGAGLFHEIFIAPNPST